jgi:hypothetical protein
MVKSGRLLFCLYTLLIGMRTIKWCLQTSRKLPLSIFTTMSMNFNTLQQFSRVKDAIYSTHRIKHAREHARAWQYEVTRRAGQTT